MKSYNEIYKNELRLHHGMGELDHAAKVSYKRLASDSLFVIRFSPDKKINFLPGQYCSIVLPGNKPVPLSIASSSSSFELEFGIEAKGVNSSTICALEVGDAVILKGPFGRFVLGDSKKVCFIAAGTGVTPFMSMMRTINGDSLAVDAKLLYGVKTIDKILWDEILSMPNVYIAFSQEEVLGHHHGRIDSAFIEQSVPDLKTRVFFICGNKEFVLSMIDILESLGVTRENIIREAW